MISNSGYEEIDTIINYSQVVYILTLNATRYLQDGMVNIMTERVIPFSLCFVLLCVNIWSSKSDIRQCSPISRLPSLVYLQRCI